MAHSYQFVDSISATPTVLLDLDNLTPFHVAEGSSVSPPRLRRTASPSLMGDGSIESGSYYEDRVITLVLVPQLVAAETQATAIQTLARILDQREGAWLKWQSEGMSEPLFYRTRRADFEVVDLVLDAQPDRTLNLEIIAQPFGHGLPETGSFTVTNDPTTGTNKMMYSFGTIKGDVLTPLHLSFPTPAANHRILVASCSALDGTVQTAPYYKSLSASVANKGSPTSYDTFTRSNSTSTMGTASPGGGTWSPQAGTWGINTNRAYCVTGVPTWATSVIDFASADAIVETLIVTQATSGNGGIVIRSASASTGLAVLATAMWDVALTTQVGPTFSQTFVSGDRMRVVAFGASIKVYRQAAGVGAWTEVMSTTTALHLSNTKHGLAIYGTSAIDARFDDFAMSAGLTSGPWTVTDAPDGSQVSGFRRTLSKTGATDPDTIVPTSAEVLQWDNLPPGDYRVLIRTGDADAGDELLFWNRPPANGATYTRDEAAAKLAIATTHPVWTGHDWHDLGVVSMPGGAPVTDTAFGLDAATGPALWNVGLYANQATIIDLDCVVLIPAGRPRTVTRIGTAAFSADYANKVVTWDGVNGRRYASGESSLTPGTASLLAASLIVGGMAAVIPGANNVLHFFASVSGGSATRIDDDKTLTTVVNYKYFPRYVYDRPAAT